MAFRVFHRAPHTFSASCSDVPKMLPFIDDWGSAPAAIRNCRSRPAWRGCRFFLRHYTSAVPGSTQRQWASQRASRSAGLRALGAGSRIVDFAATKTCIASENNLQGSRNKGRPGMSGIGWVGEAGRIDIQRRRCQGRIGLLATVKSKLPASRHFSTDQSN
jgi:hypothetical protein